MKIMRKDKYNLKYSFKCLFAGVLFLFCLTFFGTKTMAESDCPDKIMSADFSSVDLIVEGFTNNVVSQGENFALFINNSTNSFPIKFDINVLKDGTKSVYKKSATLGFGNAKNSGSTEPIIASKFEPGDYQVNVTFHTTSNPCILKTTKFSIKVLGSENASQDNTTEASTETVNSVLSDSVLQYKSNDVTISILKSSLKAGENLDVTMKNNASFDINYKIYVDDLKTSSFILKRAGTVATKTAIGDWAAITSPGKHIVKIDLFDATSGASLSSKEINVTVTPSNNPNSGKTEASSSPSDSGSAVKLADLQPTTRSTNGKVNPSLKDIFDQVFGVGGSGADANLDSVNKLIKAILTYAFDFAGIVAFVMVLWAARTFLNAYGSEEAAAMGKKTLVWAFVGLCVIIVSKALMVYIYTFLAQ